MEKNVVSLDIGGTNFRIALVDENGDMAKMEKYPSHDLFKTMDPLACLGNIIEEYIMKISQESLCAISIGLPGEIAVDGKTPLSMPNLSKNGISLDGVNIVDPLEERLNLPVFLNRDANNHLLCDVKFQNLYHLNTIIGVYFGTGVGGSVYINGSFITGKHGAGMLLGHIPFYKSDIPSHVGTYGCAESHASGYRLSKIWEEMFPDTSLSHIFTYHKNEQEIIDFLDSEALTVATIATLFDPDILILGGGVPEMQDYPYEYVKSRIKDFCKKPYPSNDLTIVRPVIKSNAGIIGAGLYGYMSLRK